MVDTSVATVELLRAVQGQLAAQNEQIRELTVQLRDVHERMIRLETHGYQNRIDKLENESDNSRVRLTILETEGKIFAAGVAAAVSIAVSVLSGALVFLLKN